MMSLPEIRDVVRRYAGAAHADRGVADVALYRLALTHRSFDHATNCERLEFMGDAVLGAVAAQYLYRRYGDQDEGFLSRLRVQLVSGAALSQLCSRIPELARGLRMSSAMEAAGGRAHPDVLEDVFEAFVGALSIDVGGYETARAWLVGVFETEVDFAAAVLAARPRAAPPRTGPAPRFTVCNVVHVPGRCAKSFDVAAVVADPAGGDVEVGRGVGGSMAAARAAALRDAACREV